MVYEYSNNPLAWNYHHWTYLLFAYFALVDKAACLLLSNAVQMYDLFMILSWKLFLVTDETARVFIGFLQMSLQYVLKCFRSSMIYLIVVVIFRLRHNFDCLIFNNDSFSTSTEEIKCSGMPVRNINKDSPHLTIPHCINILHVGEHSGEKRGWFPCAARAHKPNSTSTPAPPTRLQKQYTLPLKSARHGMRYF